MAHVCPYVRMMYNSLCVFDMNSSTGTGPPGTDLSNFGYLRSNLEILEFRNSAKVHDNF